MLREVKELRFSKEASESKLREEVKCVKTAARVCLCVIFAVRAHLT